MNTVLGGQFSIPYLAGVTLSTLIDISWIDRLMVHTFCLVVNVSFVSDHNKKYDS